MHIVKLVAAIGALTVSSLASPRRHFECGTVSCSAFGNLPIYRDRQYCGRWPTLSTCPFRPRKIPPLRSAPAPRAQDSLPNGIDAANALNAFYATQQGPAPQDDGPGIFAKIGGVDVTVFNIVTAFKTTSTPGVIDVDFTEPFLGISLPPGTGVTAEAVGSGFLCSSFAACTVWTKVDGTRNFPGLGARWSDLAAGVPRRAARTPPGTSAVLAAMFASFLGDLR